MLAFVGSKLESLLFIFAFQLEDALKRDVPVACLRPSLPQRLFPLQADGGGPLACLVDGSYVLAGITSWSLACGRRGAPPAVFASTTAVLDFIQRSTGAAVSSIHRASQPDLSATYGR